MKGKNSFAVSFLLQKEFSFLFSKCNHTKWETRKKSSWEIAGGVLVTFKRSRTMVVGTLQKFRHQYNFSLKDLWWTFPIQKLLNINQSIVIRWRNYCTKLFLCVHVHVLVRFMLNKKWRKMFSLGAKRNL